MNKWYYLFNDPLLNITISKYEHTLIKSYKDSLCKTLLTSFLYSVPLCYPFLLFYLFQSPSLKREVFKEVFHKKYIIFRKIFLKTFHFLDWEILLSFNCKTYIFYKICVLRKFM